MCPQGASSPVHAPHKTSVRLLAHIGARDETVAYISCCWLVCGGIAQPHAAAQRPLAVIDEDLARKLPARILVVEDNPVNSKVALRFLQIMGYKPGMHVV